MLLWDIFRWLFRFLIRHILLEVKRIWFTFRPCHHSIFLPNLQLEMTILSETFIQLSNQDLYFFRGIFECIKHALDFWTFRSSEFVNNNHIFASTNLSLASAPSASRSFLRTGHYFARLIFVDPPARVQVGSVGRNVVRVPCRFRIRERPNFLRRQRIVVVQETSDKSLPTPVVGDIYGARILQWKGRSVKCW